MIVARQWKVHGRLLQCVQFRLGTALARPELHESPLRFRCFPCSTRTALAGALLLALESSCRRPHRMAVGPNCLPRILDILIFWGEGGVADFVCLSPKHFVVKIASCKGQPFVRPQTRPLNSVQRCGTDACPQGCLGTQLKSVCIMKPQSDSSKGVANLRRTTTFEHSFREMRPILSNPGPFLFSPEGPEGPKWLFWALRALRARRGPRRKRKGPGFEKG